MRLDSLCHDEWGFLDVVRTSLILQKEEGPDPSDPSWRLSASKPEQVGPFPDGKRSCVAVVECCQAAYLPIGFLAGFCCGLAGPGAAVGFPNGIPFLGSFGFD